jgi:DNA integrity scanning protein DisA with diadenylate cyclase activity
VMSSGNELRTGIELLLRAHIGEHRHAWEPDKTGELCDGDFCRRGHGGVHPE